MLPCMCAALVVYFLILPVRKRHLNRVKLCSPIRREMALLIFCMYSAGLAALTLFPADFWSSIWEEKSFLQFYPTWEEILTETDYRNLFQPFQEIRRAIQGGRWLRLMLFSNILIFIPVGLFTALLWRKIRWWKVLLFGCGASVLIETVQFFIGRSTDIDDVILNTAGAMLGFWIFCLLRILFPDSILKFQCYTDWSMQRWMN